MATRTRVLATPTASRIFVPAPDARHSLQPTLHIGPANAPLEREAERAADAVMRGEWAGALASAPPAAQSACAGCATVAEKQDVVQRKCTACESAGAGHEAAGAAAASAVAGGGRPLSPELRAYFEPRFARDFSDVRIHTHSQAASAANAIGARAYTLGSHLVFASGEFAPSSPEGRRLIAHELAHVVQHPPFIARQTVPYHSHLFADRAGGGTTDFVESVTAAPVAGANGIEGSVHRIEIARATGGQAEQTLWSREVRNIRLDPSCTLVIPYRIRFRQAQSDPRNEFCQNPPSATAVPPLPTAQLDSIATRYVQALNNGLNGWFSVNVSGCAQPCANRPIPIRIEVRAVQTGEDRTVDVVNRAGRGSEFYLCAGSYSDDFAVHEGGHQVLGMNDEYREPDPVRRRRYSTLRRDERVRGDLSRMADNPGYGRFVQFNERHFRFAQVFMEAVYRGQGCTIGLTPARAPPIDFRLGLGVGGALAGGRAFTSLTGSIGVGLALERGRRLMAELGVQGGLLSAGGVDQDAYMLGFRAGLEARTSPGSFGANANLFASTGVLHRPEAPLGPGVTLPARTGGYGEVGLGLGIHSGMVSGVNFNLRAEGALGAEIASDPRALRFVRLGFSVGASF